MKIPDSLKFSNKHIQVDKSYAKIVIAVSLAAAVAMFSLSASFYLVKKIQYQNKVMSLRNTAIDKLESNKKAVNTLINSYAAFDEATESVIGTPEKNSKIVLDALPSKYDFPAFATSLEYIVKQSGNKSNGITGTDNELLAEQSSTDPKSVEIPFSVYGDGTYESSKNLVMSFERSIRPFKVTTLDLSGSDSSLKTSVVGVSYYQPAKQLEINETVVTDSGTKKTTKSVTKTETKK